MAHKILTFLFVICSIEIHSQIQYKLPTEDVDIHSVNNHQILIDPISLDFEIISSRYDKLQVKHYHRRYKASFYDLDTVALIQDENAERVQITFLMCADKEFKIDNPYIPNSEKDFKLDIKYYDILGDWYVKNHLIELEKIVNKLNSFIPQKEICNTKRHLQKKATLIAIDPFLDSEGYYWGDVEMPGIEGSNLVDHRNNIIQSRLDNCLDTIVEPNAIRFSYKVNEKGEVVKVIFDMFSQPTIELRRKIEACMLKIIFEPATYKGQPVKVKCNTLLGINTLDKYKLYENQSKADPRIRNKSSIPKELADLLLNQEVDHSNEVFIAKDSSYQDYKKYLIKRVKETKDEWHKAILEDGIENLDTVLAVDEEPKLLKAKYFEEIKEKIKILFPNESYDETIEFIVEKDGSISTTRVGRETNGKVAEWLWESLAKDLFYVPGKHKGKIVRVKIFENVKNI